ncbi:MAG TPA: sigma-70 family RNA polymerase sigma factor [Frankiaceae bacterium]|nr:sigma-70 family RNA polymerase sigma factor [Frankiaceae bacterium]
MTELRGIDHTVGQLPCAAFLEEHDERLRRTVGSVASRFRVRPEDREDLYQETVARLCGAFHGIEDTEAAFEYTERIAERVVLDWQRRARVRDQTWLGLVHRHHIADPIDPAEAAVRRARVSRVRGAVRNLPPEQRKAVVLADFGELSTADGAAAMQITPTAFKGLLQRGRDTLRRDLRNAPAVLPPLHVWRTRITAPARAAATSFVGVTAWCAMLVHPHVTSLPHQTTIAAAPAEAVHSVPVRIPAPRPTASPARPAGVQRPLPRTGPTPTGTPRRPGKSVVPDTPQVCVDGKLVDGKCVGSAKIGDELCLTEGQGHDVTCAKQDRVAICEGVPVAPYTRCERHGDPEWIVPPP